MATLPQPHTGRFTFSRGRQRSPGNRLLPAALRAQDGAEPAHEGSPPREPADDGHPSRAASVVPVLLSLAGLFALAVGAAYVGREIIGLVTSLLSGG